MRTHTHARTEWSPQPLKDAQVRNTLPMRENPVGQAVEEVSDLTWTLDIWHFTEEGTSASHPPPPPPPLAGGSSI